jgi:hypothetical protein
MTTCSISDDFLNSLLLYLDYILINLINSVDYYGTTMIVITRILRATTFPALVEGLISPYPTVLTVITTK